MHTLIFELTAAELHALQVAVTVADEYLLGDTDAARSASLDEIESVQSAFKIVTSGDLSQGYGLDADQILTDALWTDFWDQADVDFSEWFENAQELDPEGWPEFRDAGLAAAQEAGK